LQQLGLCHGNVSLENLAMGIDGNMVMIDFGLCTWVPFHNLIMNEVVDAVPAAKPNHQHILCCLIVPQGQCGKLPYMAPEIFANQLPFDGYAIDLWGAAISLFVMLVGKYPWDFAHEVVLNFCIVARDPMPLLLSHGPILHLNQYVLGCMALHMGCAPDQMSPLVCDLLACMLCHDLQEHLMLAQVLDHPWIWDGPVAAMQEEMQQALGMPQEIWRC